MAVLLLLDDEVEPVLGPAGGLEAEAWVELDELPFADDFDSDDEDEEPSADDLELAEASLEDGFDAESLSPELSSFLVEE